MLAQDIADNSLVLHNYHNWLFLFALLYHTVKDFFVLILLKTCEFCIFWTVYRFRGGGALFPAVFISTLLIFVR